jgi:putative DNA methylase
MYVEPIVKGSEFHFLVRSGRPADPATASTGTSIVSRDARGRKIKITGFRCLLSHGPISMDYVKDQAKAGRMGARMMAVVAESERGRVYLDATEEMESAARRAIPTWQPDVEFFQQALGFRVGNYGMTRWSDLFTPRQLVALGTFSDLLKETSDLVRRDALDSGRHDDGRGLDAGGSGATAYAEAVTTYLAFALSKTADYNCTLVPWYTKEDRPGHLFSKQAIPMVWDYTELNPLSEIGGAFLASTKIVADALLGCPESSVEGCVSQGDAVAFRMARPFVCSTDPPYYDNVGYADLSDFFYVWLRRSLRPLFSDLFATVETPKGAELVATPERHGGTAAAEEFFLSGMTQAMNRLATQSHPAFPVTIYYAFKQSETDGDGGTTSTGWETFLAAVIRAGFAIDGTWPIRTERGSRSRGIGSNALASSIVLVCHRRATDAPVASRREFITALQSELPLALVELQRGNIAPVDLAQAAIGPGMAVFTRYSHVVDAGGTSLSVGDALGLINQTLDLALAEQEGDFDADSRWALSWFEHSGFSEGDYGVAETLSKAKNTTVAGMVEAGILTSSRGKVRLLRPDELPIDWDPEDDRRTNAWEMLHHLVRVLEHSGEAAAAQLLTKYKSQGQVVRELAYRLYSLCEKKKRAKEAAPYNSLVQSWPEIVRLAQEAGPNKGEHQAVLFEE